MKLKMLFFLLLVQAYSFGQQPAYVSFAENEFRGIDIYDVAQDDLKNYWFATNQGLRKHNGYSFEVVSCPEMKSQSVFRLMKDKLGNIYCFNLQHQIFRIRNGQVSLFYEVPEEYRYHELDIRVDPENHLLIQSKGFIRISPDRKNIQLSTDKIFENASPLSFALLNDGSSISTSNDRKFAIQKNGIISIIKNIQFDDPKYANANIFNWFRIKDRLYGVDTRTMDVFLFNETVQSFQYVTQFNQSLANSVIRVYVSAKHIWVGGISNGISVYDHQLKPLFNGERIYSDHFVSNVYPDHEGNVLISTFNEGVKVIFNPDILRFELELGEKPNRICSSEETLFITTNRGNVYACYDGKTKRIYADPLDKEVEAAHYWPSKKLLFLATGTGLIIAEWDGKKLKKRHLINGSFKDAYFDDNNCALVAFNFGVQRLEFKEDGSFTQENLTAGRSYCVSKDPSSEMLYLGASMGLMKLDENGKLEKVKYGEDYVSSISITQSDNRLFIGTRKKGILIVEHGEIIRQIPFNGTVHNIELYDDYLFVLTNSALFRVKPDGTEKEQLNKANGLFFDHVSSFHINDGTLYITDSETLQFIDLEQLSFATNKIPIRFKKISANNQKITNGRLRYDAKNIQFEVGVSTLRYRENIRYKYRLKGFNNTWKYALYAENVINYTTLPAGDYTLEVIAVNGNAESEPIHYSFSIEAPYYQKWWFYLTLLLTSGLVIALLFLLRIRSIRKKNKAKLAKQRIESDLLESELKALRSQMNPHFIFNSLNSIQDLILQEETDASYDYIVLFAELVRSALNYSNKDFIPIGKEIEFINVYLQLEKLRFKDDFEYTIECTAPDFLNVPSMLIQPFIENALLHGLLHKAGKKELIIRFEFDKILVCTIQDNGIGRKKAAEIQARQGGKHESFALDAIDKRMKILNEKLGTHQWTYSIVDVDSEKDDSGTLVTIQLPFQRDY